MTRHRNPRRGRERRGAATVEFAMTAPVLFTLIFAGMEFSRANMLVHTAAIAASEGARAGIASGASAESCRQAALEELRMIGVRNAAVSVSPAAVTDDTVAVSVGVAIPMDVSNGYVMPKFFVGKRIVRTATMTRETKSAANSAANASAAEAALFEDLQSAPVEAL